jgi:pimeloyl-ACP methyl ester carboxylesterase
MVTAHHATINGFDMVYRVAGSGPPLVLIHGGFGGLEGYGALLPPWWVDELFAPHLTVVTYNRRGCGRSAMPDDGYTMATFVADLHALLQHFGIDQASILGVSAGGPIALRFALDHPELVTNLVLVSTAADLTVGEQGAYVRTGWEQARQRGVAWIVAEFPPAALAAPLPPDRQEQLLAVSLRNLAAYDGLDLTPELGRLSLPTLIVHGTADEVVPVAGAHRLHAGLPNSTLWLVPGEGHVLLGQPGSPTPARVLEWLRAQSPSHNPSH